MLIIIGIAMIYDALRPKCAHSGCGNSPEEGSCYCLIHDPKYYNNKNSYTSVFTTATTSRPKTTTAGSSATRATHKNTNKTSTSKSAEYDAHDYDDPEDLYEDHYDDFYDYDKTIIKQKAFHFIQMERLLHLCLFLYEKRVNYSPPNNPLHPRSHRNRRM